MKFERIGDRELVLVGGEAAGRDEGGVVGGRAARSIHASNARPPSGSKFGMVGRISGQASFLPQIRPVPRGANSHLCADATKKSAPRRAASTFSTPKPCTPSTISRQRSASARPEFALATTSARAGIGSFRPVAECTQVRPTARVFGVDRAPESFDHLRLRGLRGAGRKVVQGHETDRRTRALGRIANRLVVHVVVVLGGQDLLVGADAQAVVEQRQSGRRVGSERDLLAATAEVVRERQLAARRQVVVAMRGIEELFDRERIRVQVPAVALHRRAHHPRMRHEVEAAEVDPAGIEVELFSNPLPTRVRGEAIERRRRVSECGFGAGSAWFAASAVRQGSRQAAVPAATDASRRRRSIDIAELPPGLDPGGNSTVGADPARQTLAGSPRGELRIGPCERRVDGANALEHRLGLLRFAGAVERQRQVELVEELHAPLVDAPETRHGRRRRGTDPRPPWGRLRRACARPGCAALRPGRPAPFPLG